VRIEKAVITAAGAQQRLLPLQNVIDRDGEEKPVLAILVEEVLSAKIEEICIVVHPGDESRYAQAAGKHAHRLRFVAQEQPLGYGHAVWCARSFAGNDAFLHLVGDHLYVSGARTCAQRMVELAAEESCAVSAVQVTREGQLGRFGAVGGRRVPGRQGLYRVESVIEKPTPTEAEQKLMIPGIRAGHYLCFFGMHVLTAAVMPILDSLVRDSRPATLSAALAELAKREQYLAVEEAERRFDIGEPYGLLMAQLALALSGRDRDEVLTRMVELLASRELAGAAEAAR
jgi:UTP--glucose-1-phosphate uridylyltransferase